MGKHAKSGFDFELAVENLIESSQTVASALRDAAASAESAAAQAVAAMERVSAVLNNLSDPEKQSSDDLEWSEATGYQSR